MKKILSYTSFLTALFCSPLNSSAQIESGVISLSPKDTLICPGQTITISGQFSTQVDNNNNDDFFGGVVDIGFDFVYYGVTYNQCVISGNNFLTFNTGLANGGSNYIYSGAKSSGQLDKAIMFPFHDTNPATGGTIKYQTFGKAPNRRFVVEFCKMPLFSCTAMLVTDQVVLYEGSNIIEMYIGEKPQGCAWQGGTAIQGLRNGTVEFLVPGRDIPNTQWSASLDGRRFTPNGPTYILDTIPYNPAIIIPDKDSSDLIWFEEGNPLPIGFGASITVTPTANINYYYAQITGQNGCLGNQTYIYQDTTWIHYGTAYDTIRVEICAGTTYNWYGRDLFKADNYDTLLKTTLGCDSFLRLILTVNDLPDVSLKGSLDLAICEGSAATLSILNPSVNNTYQWYRNGAALPGETNPSLSAEAAGSYTVSATTDKGCQATSSTINLTVNPNPEAEIKPVPEQIICAYDTLQLEAVPGPGYDYRWEPGRPFRIITGTDGQIVKGVFVDPVTEVVLTVYNQFGCYDMDTLVVPTKPCCEVFIPNAFSPNNDGNNDYFNPVLQPGQILLELKIFDRYGKLVYNNSNIKKGWDGRYEDGTEASIDTYMYYAKYTCADGKLYEKRESVSLLR
jgi:gliding motility-associated-like protein